MTNASRLDRISAQLHDLTQLPVERQDGSAATDGPGGRAAHDLVLRTPEHVFIVEFKHQGTAEQVGGAIRRLREWTGLLDDDTGIPLVVVPYMGAVGRRLCEEAGVSWLDLSGNAWIHGPGLHVTVQGKPNAFSRRGRPKDVFAPKASRLARVLLLDPSVSWTQQALAEETGLSKGYVSKVVNRLEEAGLVQRGPDRALLPAYPDLLLDTWSESYDFADHEIHRGHLAVRSPEQALPRLARALDQMDVEYATTGLAAAWHYTPHAPYRLVTMYVARSRVVDALRDIGVRPVDSGANVWVVVPNDAGVFAGARMKAGIRYVSAVQTYLDLAGHPERAAEAAEAIRERCLDWSHRAAG